MKRSIKYEVMGILVCSGRSDLAIALSSSWPKTLERSAFRKFVLKHEGNEIDRESLKDMLKEYTKFVLKVLPISSLIIEHHAGVDEAWTNEFRSKPAATRPPIVVTPFKGKFYVWDGNHRALAAKLNKEKTIIAYVATN